MKKIFGLTLMLMFIASTCSALNFSQAVYIGKIWTDIAGFYGNGLVFENATYNNGEEKKPQTNRNLQGKSYSKGIAKFGNGSDALYVHYDMKEKQSSITREEKFGAEDIRNTIGIPIWEGCQIYQIKNDGDITLYCCLSYYGDIGHNIIFGKRKDGVFVKYIDTRNITEKYLGTSQVLCKAPVYNDNTIVVEYLARSNEYPKKTPDRKGEFRFKWDESAQWFGVEQVVH